MAQARGEVDSAKWRISRGRMARRAMRASKCVARRVRTSTINLTTTDQCRGRFGRLVAVGEKVETDRARRDKTRAKNRRRLLIAEERRRRGN
jgi:hypothetical protein